jgi:predicted HTH transcriptional regulator
LETARIQNSNGWKTRGASREECLSGRSMPRNRELMRIFRDLDLVEQLEHLTIEKP